MTGTLSDMTVEQLRDLAKRAEATLKEKEAAKVLHFGAVGVLVQDDTHAGVKTSTHYFSVDKKTGVLCYDLDSAWFAAQGVARVTVRFERYWFGFGFKDSINTAENRAAVLQLLATVGVWK